MRIAKFLAERIRPAIHRDRRPLAIEAWEVPGEPVPFTDAVRQNFEPF
jgi:alpha-mannosidase